MLQERHWSGADLAREASKFVPDAHRKRNGKRHVIGRHIVSAYCRAENEPSSANLSYIARALGVEPSELLLPRNRVMLKPQVQAITSLDGKTRLIVDAELDTELAMNLIQQIRDSFNRT